MLFNIIGNFGHSYYITKDSSYASKSTYNITQIYYKFQKITDENLVNDYMQALKDGKSISTVFNIKVSDVEAVDSWNACTNSIWYNTEIEEEKLPKDQGTYYLWLKGKDVDSKTVYGCLIVNIDSDGPTVKSIQVTDPKEGTYKSGQTIKIRAYFSENITGDSVPTLKIKFGTSPERELTNGTIKSNYIEYSYDIQATDVGQIATVSFEGGSIKDATGNKAKLSCPIISGNTIKANVEGTTTTQTDNQDKIENKTTGGNTSNTSSSSTSTSNTGSSTTGSTTTTQTSGTTTSNGGSTTASTTDGTSGSSTPAVTPKTDDSTTATKTLPNTGGKTIIFVVISVVLATGGFAYHYFVKFKDVK